MRWVEGNHGEDTTPLDPIVSLGLHYLHGFDITESLIKADKLTQHGLESARAYQATPADIESFFTYWCEQGALFDVDAEAWRRSRAEMSLRTVLLENGPAEAETLGSRMIESGLLDPNVVIQILAEKPRLGCSSFHARATTGTIRTS
jgi:hypothetical protein